MRIIVGICLISMFMAGRRTLRRTRAPRRDGEGGSGSKGPGTRNKEKNVIVTKKGTYIYDKGPDPSWFKTIKRFSGQ